MSEVKVNKISPRSSTTVTLGDASDLFQLPASAEIDIAVGATLDVNGTIDVTGATTTGFPSGLSVASQWRLTADFTGDAGPIASNLEQVDAPVGFGVKGSSMTESSGIFTFPSSGYYLIRFHAYFIANTNSLFNRIKIQTTTNDSTYAVAAITSGAAGAANQEQGISTENIFDVTDTTQCKCRYDIDVNAAGVKTKGDTGQHETFMTFMKMRDT